MFLLLSKLRRLVLPPLWGELSAKRDVQELPGRTKASSNYLRKVSFFSLLHQSAPYWPVLCLCLTPPSPHPCQSCDMPSTPCSQSSLPPRAPSCDLCHPPCPCYCGDATASPGQLLLTLPRLWPPGCPSVLPWSPSSVLLLLLWLLWQCECQLCGGCGRAGGTAAFCDSLQLFCWAQSKQNETVIKIYEIIVSQKPAEKEKR